MICPLCGSLLCEYSDADVKEKICWNCGYYESDSQAYRECPELFTNLVRNNPSYFIEKYLRKSSDESLHDTKNRRRLDSIIHHKSFKSDIYTYSAEGYFMNEEKALKPTWTEEQRKTRLEALKEEIKAKQKMAKDEVYRFALNNFGVSIRIIDSYLKELTLLDLIEFVDEMTENGPLRTFVVWKGDK